MDTNLTIQQIESAIVQYTNNARVDIFVPNVSFGYFRTHEADLLQLTQSGYLTEYEIKRSYADFLADFKKSTTHFENKVARMYYVVPESIAERCKEYIEQYEFAEPYCKERNFGRAPVGLLCYNENGIMRSLLCAPHLASYTHTDQRDYKLFLEEQLKIMRLGCMRRWL